MSRLTKLVRSQNAHMGLRQKAADVPGKRGEVLYTYHNKILQIQKHQKRVLTKFERREEFKSINSHFNKKTSSYAQMSNEFFKYGKYE